MMIKEKQVFGDYEVVRDLGRKADNQRHYLVRCKVCGHEKEVSENNFIKQSKEHSKLNCHEDYYRQYVGKRFGDYKIENVFVDTKRGAMCTIKCVVCGNVNCVPFDVAIQGKSHNVMNCGQTFLNGVVGQAYGDYTVTKYLGEVKNYHFFELKCNKCGRKIKKSLVYLRGVVEHKYAVPKCEIECVKGITDPLEKMIYKAISVRFGNIKNRCSNPNCKIYSRYGARGIKLEYENAYELFLDFKDEFKKCKTIDEINELEFDRINNNDNYRKDNLRLAKRHTQNINTKRKKTFLLKIGEETILTNDVYFVGKKYDYINPRALKNAINLKKSKYKDVEILKVYDEYLTIEEAEKMFETENITTKFLV